MFDTHTHILKRNAIVDLDPVDIIAPHVIDTYTIPILTDTSTIPVLTKSPTIPDSISSHPILGLTESSIIPDRKHRPIPSPLLRKGYTYSVGIHPWNYLRVTPASLRLLRALAAEPQVLAIGECGLDPTHHYGNHPFPATGASPLTPTAPLFSIPTATLTGTPTPPLTGTPTASLFGTPTALLSDTPISPFSGKQHSAQQSASSFQTALPPSRTEIIEAQTTLLHLHYTLSETLRKPLILHIVKAFPEIIALKKQWHPTQPWIIHGFRGKPQLARELLAHGFHLSFGKKYNSASLALTPPSRLHRETDQT